MATTRFRATPDLCATGDGAASARPGGRADARATDEHNDSSGEL
jgi:hypothetical protein